MKLDAVFPSLAVGKHSATAAATVASSAFIRRPILVFRCKQAQGNRHAKPASCGSGARRGWRYVDTNMFDEQSSGILLPPSPALWIPQPNTPAECAIICPPVPIAIEQIANRLENAGAAHNKLHHTAHTAKSPHTWAAHLACLPTAPVITARRCGDDL
ncbi:predicted protein [Coccidioides posadasii str. Silveira]|uniref:Predicted protein n=1 Tax=Coccidioides posadasii (strain RMSCC 757 / Silveira) TaxID=443226 RepID=E9DG78_COCPS|nr:predicted protein [Coccidioides posadasii str. Silveira]